MEYRLQYHNWKVAEIWQTSKEYIFSGIKLREFSQNLQNNGNHSRNYVLVNFNFNFFAIKDLGVNKVKFGLFIRQAN